MAYSLWACVFLSVSGLATQSQSGQVSAAAPAATAPLWVNHGRLDGHLALHYSPAGAFSPDSSTLVFAHGGRVALLNLGTGNVQKVMEPQFSNVTSLNIESANFLDATRLLLLGVGSVRKGQSIRSTPELAFQWNITTDKLAGKVEALGGGGGFGPIFYFPQIKYLGLYKKSAFTVWDPVNSRIGVIRLPELTRQPNVYDFSPNGHWLLLAQIQGNSNPNPIVVRLSEHKFVDTLNGHGGAVLSIQFSRDSKEVVTACQDGKVRVYSAPGWKLLETLSGHQGAVNWAEFSPDGRWVASAGQDGTVRIWSVAQGKLYQTLKESGAPVQTVAFAPNGQYLAATTDEAVLVWQRTAVRQ